MFIPYTPITEWEEHLTAQGYDLTHFKALGEYVESFICELCKVCLISDLHIVLEPPMGLVVRRKFHISCLISHLALNLDNLTDEITNYVSKETNR